MRDEAGWKGGRRGREQEEKRRREIEGVGNEGGREWGQKERW